MAKFTHLALAAAAIALHLAPVAIALAAAPPVLEPGMQLTFRGGVAPIGSDRSAGEPIKTFTLTLWIEAAAAPETQVAWSLDEQGAGGFGWLERIGRLRLAPELTFHEGAGPALLFDRDDNTGLVPLPAMLYAPDVELADGATWSRGRYEFEVQAADQRAERPIWRIAVTRNYGRWGTIWLDREAPLVVARQQSVFMGQGEEHRLDVQLADVDRLAPEAMRRISSVIDAVESIRDEMRRPRRTETPEFGARGLEVVRGQLPELEQLAAGGPLEPLARQARRDFTAQSSRADDVGALVERYVGRPAGRVGFEGLGAKGLVHDDLKGRVTVLHFWEYRDSPLKEPYGQIGYLDFLHEQRRRDGVAVYGVAVDDRLDDPSMRGAALRSIRKLRSFMNLGYPLLLDGGAGVKEFGDPRQIGTPLPLFVVIDRDARIRHYHVGYYEVDRDAGLAELDAAVSEALRQ